ncbi:MAG: ATP-dependent helicase RecQ [Candidatus Hydrogenedentota bacterium]
MNSAMEVSTATPLTPEQALKRHWGYDQFRPVQREAVQCVLEHRDSVVVLPTGGGKSLCFQLPALLMDGMAVVVSPLIALMKDQVDALLGMGIPAAAINSSLSDAERRSIADDIRARRLKLVYVTPERLVQPRFVEYLKNNHLSFLAVDEAHCISQWGHDFRPEYRELGMLRESFPDVGIHAYTATATPQVRDDIARQLCLRNAVFHAGNFDRPNLIYRVHERGDLNTQIREVLRRNAGSSGIIYCLRRKDVDAMCATLCAEGHKALPYHAGMDNESRRRNQEAFIRDEADIIVATVAFGMGIDKPDVRFVIHTGMPKSIEHYQQESGRAGRDGLQSECVLLYGRQDYQLWRSFAEKESGEGLEGTLRKLGLMMDYCTLPGCRHAQLTRYFGESMRVEKCVSCDVCLGEIGTMEGAGEIARKILETILQSGERFGGAYIASLLRGEADERAQRLGHHRLPTFGSVRREGAPLLRQWIEQLAAQEFIEQSVEYRTLQLTTRGHAFLHGRDAAVPLLTGGGAESTPRARRAAAPASLSLPEHKSLFASLRAYRAEIAHEEGVPPYLIFGDRTLVELAVARPMDLDAFSRVHGVGSIKLEKYGEQFLAHIREFAKNQGMGEAPAVPATSSTGRRTSVSRQAAVAFALELFRGGASIASVAEEMQRSLGTVSGYLEDCVRNGDIDDLSPWVKPEAEAAILSAAEHAGSTGLREIREALDNEFDYDAIRLVLAKRSAPAR